MKAKEIYEKIDSFEQEQLKSIRRCDNILARIATAKESTTINNVEAAELIAYLLESRGNINGCEKLNKAINKALEPIVNGILYGFDSVDYFTKDIEEW